MIFSIKLERKRESFVKYKKAKYTMLIKLGVTK